MEVTPDLIILGLIWYLVFLFSTTLHEAAHALFAWKLGDPTAYHGGQVTLNPLPHIQREPMGTVLFPIASFFLMGWTVGWASAPYDPSWAERYPKRAALMALAGPLSNLLLVLISGIAIRIGIAAGFFRAPDLLGFSSLTTAVNPGGEAAATLLSVGFTLNLVLFVFNLLPVPPLDGSAMLPALISPSAAATYRNFLRQPMMGLVGLLVAWRIFGWVFGPVHSLAIQLLYPGLVYR
jgi:Zn-dependent protease